MYTRSGAGGKIDALFIAEGEFKWARPLETPPQVKLLAVYANGSTGATLGSLNVGAEMLSERALDAFSQFLDIVEEEVGSYILGDGGWMDEPGQQQMAESEVGLKPLGSG
jgi:hypothetical protein